MGFLSSFWRKFNNAFAQALALKLGEFGLTLESGPASSGFKSASENVDFRVICFARSWTSSSRRASSWASVSFPDSNRPSRGISWSAVFGRSNMLRLGLRIRGWSPLLLRYARGDVDAPDWAREAS